ncbi:MAG: ADP-ribose pyrophosphatase [Actinobacteria bacterium]|nr:MAG: ADP-ribose pyrophosphatase [Actinomycetota bacterium]
MATPDFVLELRKHVGHKLLWLPGCTAVVTRSHPKTHAGENEGKREVLVVQRADSGQWTPVTGIVDPEEEPAAAAIREVWEEAAVKARPVRLLSVEVVGPVVYPNGDKSSYVDTAFHLEWEEGEPWPADGENVQALFVPEDELPEMNERFTRTIARALSQEKGAAFRY